MYFYQKSDVLYQMTVVFCNRFIALYGDRTRDQMIQAARSGKQNFVEGLSDGVSSVEMMLKLINVGRASLRELREDYLDYAKVHNVVIWGKRHPRYNRLLAFCKERNNLSDYQDLFNVWGDEEFCNTAITLCHITDRMVCSFLRRVETSFIKDGGIKERMYKVRTNQRNDDKSEVDVLRGEVKRLNAEVLRLCELLSRNNISY
ncbi:MAG: four helix bundle suffix domain-containing protein [Bacteroidia bacterium]|nr:four helix bundle suffix domain-containing protein [Bacteroidia bacterium]